MYTTTTMAPIPEIYGDVIGGVNMLLYLHDIEIYKSGYNFATKSRCLYYRHIILSVIIGISVKVAKHNAYYTSLGALV